MVKVEEEMHELNAEVESGASQDKIDEEFGDVMFSLINYSRSSMLMLKIHSQKPIKKFIDRFMLMEEMMKKDNVSIDDSSLEEMDVYWR